MIFRIIVGAGLIVLAVLIVIIGGIGLSLGALALALVLVVIGAALVVSTYLLRNFYGIGYYLKKKKVCKFIPLLLTNLGHQSQYMVHSRCYG
jgi:multisubunit Na+/H+ antiporter MnhG subunit